MTTLAQLPSGCIILLRPLSELSSHLWNRQLPPLELLMRAVKTVALAIFRGHLYDGIAITSNKGIGSSKEVLSVAEMQKKYRYRLETAHTLIPYHTIPKLNAIGIAALFKNPSSGIQMLLNSNQYMCKPYIKVVFTDEDFRAKFNYLFSQGKPEEILALEKKYPFSFQEELKKQETTPFKLAARSKNIPLAKYYAQNLEEVNPLISDNNLSSPLQEALALGDLEIINLLLKQGALQNVFDSGGNNMMHYAALSGKIEVVKLVSNWKYLEGYKKRSSHVSVPEAFWAAESGNLDCLKYLIENPPDQTALKMPRPEGIYDHELPKLHESNNALDPFKHHSARGTILHYGVKSDSILVVDYLIQNGVDPLKKRNQQFEYPIYFAINQGNVAMVKYLWPHCKEKGMKIDDQNGTLLYYAVAHGKSLEIVSYLINEGASLTCAADSEGETLLDRLLETVNAPDYKNEEIKNYILSLKQ